MVRRTRERGNIEKKEMEDRENLKQKSYEEDSGFNSSTRPQRVEVIKL